MYGIIEDNQLIATFSTPLTMRSNHPVFGGDAVSLKRYTARRNSQRWEIQAEISPQSSGANLLYAKMITHGMTLPVTVKVPQNYGVLLSRSSGDTPAVATGVYTADSVTVTYSGFIPVGTMVQFSNHTKVYMVTESRTDSGVVKLYPTLRSPVPASVTMKWRDDVHAPFFFDFETVIGMQYIDGILMTPGAITLVEAI